MILGLLKLWMNSKVPPMDMDPHLCHIKHTMIFSSMLVIGMIRQEIKFQGPEETKRRVKKEVNQVNRNN